MMLNALSVFENKLTMDLSCHHTYVITRRVLKALLCNSINKLLVQEDAIVDFTLEGWDSSPRVPFEWQTDPPLRLYCFDYIFRNVYFFHIIIYLFTFVWQLDSGYIYET